MSVQLESLDILADLLLRFGGMLVGFHTSIQEALLPQLSSSRLAVRKRTIIAIGHLVATCTQSLFEKTMEFLMAEVHRNANISTTRTYICCITGVSKAAGQKRFGEYLKDVMAVAVGFCTEVEDDELREYCIQVNICDFSLGSTIAKFSTSLFQAFESFVLRCPAEIGPHVDMIEEICAKFLCHDPNYHYDDDDETMEVDKNGDGTEDTSYSGDLIYGVLFSLIFFF